MENNDKSTKRKYLTWIWLLWLFLMVVNGIVLFLPHLPLNTLLVSGKVVFLDENGNKIENRRVKFQCFSKYSESLLRSDRKRWYRSDNVQEDFQFRIPKYPATCFVEDTEGKYATVFKIDPKKPTTELEIELRPRYTCTAKLVSATTQKPLCNQKFQLCCCVHTDLGRVFPFQTSYGIVATFHKIELQTDSNGKFSVDGMIPGTKYQLNIWREKGGGYRAKMVQIPFLKPEEYEQPFSFGDIFIPNSVTTETEDF